MTATNELLTVAIALISSLTNTVHVPPQSAPVEAKDVVNFYVDLPSNPTDMRNFTGFGDLKFSGVDAYNKKADWQQP